MKILKPVKKAIPLKHRGKYLPIWVAVKALKDGKFLPVECDSMERLKLLQATASGHRTMNMETFSEGTTLFLRKRA